MKKFFLSAAVALALLTSCGGSASSPSLNDLGINTEQVSNDMNALVEKIKANAENMDLDAWKDAYREMNKLSMPVVAFSAKMTKEMQDNPVDAASKYEKAAEELGAFMPKFNELSQAILALANESGAAAELAQDAEFQQELQEMSQAAMQ